MTSQKDKIQSLIADIEQVLDTQRPKKPWVRASDMEPQRQTLAKAQAYLRSLQESFDAPAGWGPVDPATGQLIAPDAADATDAGTESSATNGAASSAVGVFSGQPQSPGATPEDVLQSLLTEMKFLKSSALEPLRREMDALRQERDGLQQEVEGLEAQRSAMVTAGTAAIGTAAIGHSSISDEQLNDFLAVLMERLQERLSVQVTQTLGQLESDHADAIAKLTEATDAEVLQLRPAGQSIEEMRELQTRSDQLLVNIESTLQGMYETLQKNIDSYQISLNEGIENMHSLGRQGEVIVRSLVDHLTQQLGQTALPEPAFFPAPQGNQSNLTYALVDSPDLDSPDLANSDLGSPDLGSPEADLSSAVALPTAAAVSAAVSSTDELNDADDSSDDTVSSLNEILPEGSVEPVSASERTDESINETVSQSDSQTDSDNTSETETSIAAAATGGVIAAAILQQEKTSQEAEISQEDETSQENETQGTESPSGEQQDNEIAPEDCIREDGTIDLDLLKLDIDRDDENEVDAEDVMIDAAVADAQVAATEAEDPEIEAKVTPTADAAYLADLTLDDLTSVEDLLSEEDLTAGGDLVANDLADTSIAEAGDEPLSITPEISEISDINTGESLFAGLTEEPMAEEPMAEEPLSRSAEERAEKEEEESRVNEAEQTELETAGPDTTESVADDETLLSAPFASEELIAEADADEANEAIADIDSDITESSVTDSDSASDSTDDKENGSKAGIMATAALGAAAALKAKPSESSDELEEFWNPSTVEQPESAKVPDIPDAEDEGSDVSEPDNESDSLDVDDTVSSELAAELEADSLRADQIASDAVMRGLEAVSTLTPDLEEPVVSEEEMPEPAQLGEETEPMESSKMPDWPDDESETSEVVADGTAEPASEEELDAESTLNLATSLNAPEPPQFVDEDPFGTDLALTDTALDGTETSLIDSESSPADAVISEATSSDTTASAAPADFDDDLDFFETSDVGDKAAEDLIEKLSTESLDEGGYTDDEATEISQPVEGLTEFPELPAIAPPLPMPPLPQESETGLVDSDLTDSDLTDSLSSDRYDDDSDEGEDDPTDGEPASWFLGIDLGTTGLSAVLINRLGEQVYPLYWDNGDRATSEASRETGSEADEAQYGLFRLPVVLQIADDQTSDSQTQPIAAVGLDALSSKQSLRTVKPLLKVGIPFGTSQNSTNEGNMPANGPFVQWSDHQALPLQSIQDGLVRVLSTLSPKTLGCRAINLKQSALRRILGSLESVAVGYPNNWPDTYSFNIREAVLSAGIVSRPDQIFFVEEAIAALLSALPDPQAEMDEADMQQPSLYNCKWEGGTVIISAGATLTEAGVVNLPAELDQLIYRDFALRSFTYAGDSLDQDIICQLLHVPAKQAAEPSTSTGWESLGLDQLQLPQAGEADRIKRHRLRQRLNDSQLGREVVAAARDLKMVLQEETQCELTLAGQSWVVKRKDLETKVFIPYIQRVNRQIHSLLNQKGLSTQAVKQVICTGGSAALGAIARWLRQKFPNATIIQDTYSGEYSNSCSRVAYGLANLCHYPHVLDTHRHQYNDYFLLLELLRVLPDQPLPAGGILHLLEQRGVNIQACQSHILALIEGHLPPGLVPTEGDRPLISAQSPNIETYRALSELPLFRKQGGQIYIADEEQGKRLRQHLEALLSTKHQTLSESLSANLVSEQAT